MNSNNRGLPATSCVHSDRLQCRDDLSGFASRHENRLRICDELRNPPPLHLCRQTDHEVRSMDGALRVSQENQLL